MTRGGGPPHPRRYIAAIIIGVSVAVAALVAALLLTRASPSREGAVIGVGGAPPAPAGSPPPNSPAASAPPETPPAAMGDHQAGDRGSFFVRVADQRGDGRSVTVEDASLARSGWIVIHADAGGAPGVIIGVSSPQAAAQHVNVTVPLTTAVTSSSFVFVMLHTEDNDTAFDYPSSDQPAQAGGQIVMVRVYLAVQP